MKQAIHYKSHKVIFADSLYYARIILSIDDALYEMRMSFNITGATLTTLKMIMKLKEAEN